MKKFVIALVVASLGMTAAACGPNQAYQDDQYAQSQPVAVQPQGTFLERHGDALVAGGVGLLAGRALANRQRQTTQHVILHDYRRPYGYGYSRPPRVVILNSRSSGYGAYRSRRH